MIAILGEYIMNKNLFTALLGLLFLVIIFYYGSVSFSAQTESGPIIHFGQTTHTFPAVFEGVELSHTFTIFNKGTANLKIKKITHS